MRLSILPAFAALAAITLSSCYVLPDPPPQNPEKKPDATLTDKEQQEIKAQRDKKKEEDALKQKAEDPGAPTNPDATAPTSPKPKSSAPTAQPVPGKEGYVFSPFNQKIVDVREIPSGTLVADPTYPASEKKHFRVP